MEIELYGYIYIITNIINGKQYIGKTVKTIEERFQEHIGDSKKERCENRPLYVAMNKYGIENFKLELIEKVKYTELGKELEEREKYWIDYFDTYNDGYNATIGGDGKMLINHEKVIKTYLEVQNILETANICNCSKDSVHDILTSNNIEIISSTEQMKKIYGRKVVQKKDDKVLAIFNSVREAAEIALGDVKKNAHILECAKGARKTAYGFVWAFA